MCCVEPDGFIRFSLQHIGALLIVLGQAKGPALSLFLVFLFLFLACRVSCGISVPRPGIEPGPQK